MSRLQLPRARASAVSSYVLLATEVVVDQDAYVVRLGDGYTPGGIILSDSSPNLTSVIDRPHKADRTGVRDSVTSFQSAAAAARCVHVPAGDYLLGTVPVFSTPTILDIAAGVNLTGAGGVMTGETGDCKQLIALKTAPDEFATQYIRRNANHTGGTIGFESAGLRVDSYVSSTNTNVETSIVAVIYNAATGSAQQNSAIHARGLKVSTSPTWSYAGESQDTTMIANPTTGLVGIEQVIAGAGTDNLNNRVGIDIIAARPIVSGAYAGAAAAIGYGLRLINQVADTGVQNAFKQAISVQGYVLQDCIDLASAIVTPGGTGLRLRDEMPISFSTNRDRTMEFTNGFLNYRVGGTPVFQVSDGGQLQIQSAIYFFPGPSVTPGANGMMTLEGTSNTLAKLKFKGTDGVVRSSSFTLS